jgi:hypothetical protein
MQTAGPVPSNFYSDPRTVAEKEDLRSQATYYQKSGKLLGTVGPQYHPWWLSNPGNSARRARWIEWLDEWGFLEADNC